MGSTRLRLSTTALLLVATLSACGGEPEVSASVLADHLAEYPPSEVFRFNDAYGDQSISVSIICPYTDDAVSRGVDEDEQAVIVTTPDGPLDLEILPRRTLDLCADTSPEAPRTVDPAASLTVVQHAWSDGASVPSLRYD